MKDSDRFRALVNGLYGDRWVEKTAGVLGVSKYAVYHWASGRRGVPQHVMSLLKVLSFYKKHGLDHENVDNLLEQLKEMRVKSS